MSLAHVVIAQIGGDVSPIILSIDADAIESAWPRRVLRPLLRRVACILAADTPTVEWCQAIGIDAERVTPVPPAVANGVDLKEQRPVFLKRHALPPGAKLIVIADSLCQQNNLTEAIWCYELVRTIHPSARLLIYGDGPDWQQIDRIRRLISDDEGIRQPGSFREFHSAAPHFDVYWSARTVGAAPPGLLKAMQNGVSVVANNAASIRDIVNHQINGFLVRDNDRKEFAGYTVNLLTDQQLKKQIGQAAIRTTSDRLSFDRLVNQLVEAYASFSS